MKYVSNGGYYVTRNSVIHTSHLVVLKTVRSRTLW